jgi:transcriptional regulator with XRE-family HTH domain
MTVTIKRYTRPSTHIKLEVPQAFAGGGTDSEADAEKLAQREQEFNVFFARLTTASEAAGFTDPLKWAAENGVASQSLRNLRTDRKPPGLNILQRLSKASGKSINWWLGEDEAFNTDEFVFIPRYKTANGDEPVTMAFRRYWVEKYLKTDPKHLTVYRVEDDVMQGTFNISDNVLIHSREDTVTPLKDGLCALILNGALIIRRIQVLPNNLARIMPDNPKYPAFEVELSENSGVEFVGVPVWFSRQL